MISFSKVKSAIIEGGRRILKVREYGAKTAVEVAPFGDDSNPIKEMTAIYAQTQENGDRIIIGYINEQQLAAVGEKRLYSIKADGSIGSFVWLKNDGTLELSGSADNAVRYQALDNALQNMVTKINAENLKIQAAITALGGTYVQLPVDVITTPARINEVKTS